MLALDILIGTGAAALAVVAFWLGRKSVRRG